MRWAALLRGINAGVKLPMVELRAFLADQGMRDVATVLASGNAVFDADETEGARLEAQLGAALGDRMGIYTGWFLRSHADLVNIVSANPFPDAAADHPHHLLVHFGRDVVDDALIDRVRCAYTGPERLHAIGRELYVDYPADVGHSKLPQAMNRAKLAVGSTARTWNTLTTLVALTAPAPAG